MAAEFPLQLEEVPAQESINWVALCRGLFVAVTLYFTLLMAGNGIGRALSYCESLESGLGAAVYHVPLP